MNGKMSKRFITAILVILITIFGFSLGNVYAASDYLFGVRQGGFPIAFSLDADGVIIDEVGFVQTEAGYASFANKLRRGDFIVAIDGEKIKDSAQIKEYLKNTDGKEVDLEFLRKGEKNVVTISPYIDLSGSYDFGLMLRDNISGAGMVTFVRNNGFFAALGHKVVDSVAGDVPIESGKVYGCEIGGIVKSRRGSPGELQAYVKGGNIGEVFANTEFGLYGRMNVATLSGDMQIASVDEVTPGKAFLCTTVSDSPKMYEIEIIKASKQADISEKGLVLRIVDQRLLALTGGIVQGMSGSPILQNGKIVGAVTHVFTADPTKGYGIYAQWMRDY